MIWATVRSWSCFCWLYRTSPSLVANNIINLILVLTIWWCPCVDVLVLLEESVCYDQCALLAKLCQPLPCFILYSKSKLTCYTRYLLTSYFCIPVLCDGKDIFFSVSSRRSCKSQKMNHMATQEELGRQQEKIHLMNNLRIWTMQTRASVCMRAEAEN